MDLSRREGVVGVDMGTCFFFWWTGRWMDCR